ncbi:hypothetical protein GJW-30_1_01794 [Variibacter gotjawalensis]|uniref:Uncharacterized protein n=1 Tax=Variibacter gotjawalensis TaxID=1333996 RepID=A0A0S3PTI5_9BRAD|nr:hypothetical protein [Variibacter gotjawalensis]NIK49579.1 hypothetical protein [Variibacter gotjawalensis]RZS45590.1 hypothetical protein EV661_3909 [Variibacter gotjawalensis]BAT59263.1 hypothetical protein GJW-30_1_01794 [Variibacter gotjawalensis]
MPNQGPLAQPRKAPRFFRALGQNWRRLVNDLFDPYHPERHYMRGPGPKWRAKHALDAKA